jgi:hypothetical protein
VICNFFGDHADALLQVAALAPHGLKLCNEHLVLFHLPVLILLSSCPCAPLGQVPLNFTRKGRALALASTQA